MNRNDMHKFAGSTLYVSDLDGTLLDDDARLSALSRSNIMQMVEANIPFTVATARAIQTTQPVLENLGLRLPAITFNGAFISNIEDGSYELAHSLTDEYVSSILEIGRSNELIPFVSTTDGSKDHLYYPNTLNGGMESYLAGRMAAHDSRLTAASSTSRYLSEQIVCFTFIDRLSVIEHILSELQSTGIDVATSLFENRYSPGWYWLTVRNAKANKGMMTRELMSRYGLRDFKLVTFGDEMNDVDLLEQADYGVAMENGAADLQEIADEVIGSNTEDAVTHFILRHAGI